MTKRQREALKLAMVIMSERERGMAIREFVEGYLKGRLA